MAKKKSNKRDVNPQEMPLAIPAEMQALFGSLGISPGDLEALALLQTFAQSSDMDIGELIDTMLPGFEESEEVRPRGKKPGRKSRSSKSKTGARVSDDLDELVELALAQRSLEKNAGDAGAGCQDW